jgi:hypothetical protein
MTARIDSFSQRAPQARERLCLPSGRVKAPRVIVVLFGHPVPRVAENERSIADMTWVFHSDRGRGGVAKEMRRDPAAKLLSGVVENPSLHHFRHELGSDFRDPEGIEPGIDRRLRRPFGGRPPLGCAANAFPAQEDGSMDVEIALEPRGERRGNDCLVRDMRFGLIGGEQDLPAAADLGQMAAKPHTGKVL